MNKKVRKSTSIVSGVLISTSLINNAVSLASVSSTAKAGITALGKGSMAAAKGGIDLLVVPAIKGIVTWISSYLFLFLLVYGFYYNQCVLHTGKVASCINAFISIPGLIISGVKEAANYMFDKDTKESDKNKAQEAENLEKAAEVISVEDLEKEIKSIEESLSKGVSNNEGENRNKIEVLKKRLEATRGSLNYKLNWLKFQLGAPFHSEIRKQYSDLKTRLEDISSGLDEVTNITKKWKKVRDNKENKLSWLLLEESEKKENPLVALLQEVELLGGNKSSFLKQYSQIFFNEYIKELKEEVFKKFESIVKGEKEKREDAFSVLKLGLDDFSKAKPQFSKETKKWCDHLECMYKLLTVEEQVQEKLLDCGFDSPSTAEQLLNFVFGKGFLDMNVLIGVFKGFFAANDNINKPKKELKDEDLLTILEKIDSEKSDLVTLKGDITSAINELKKIEENDFSKSILEKAEKTEKMLDSLFEKKGGDEKNLMSVAGEYAEFCKEVKKIKEKTFDEEEANTLKDVLQLLPVFYEEKSKQLDGLLGKIPTEEKYNKDFVKCWKESVLKLKGDYANIGSKLKEFAKNMLDFSSTFVTHKEEMVDVIARDIFLNNKQDMSYIFSGLETDFDKDVCSLNFAELNEVKELWEGWKSDFIKKYESEVNEKVAALRTEAEEEEKQAEEDEKIIEDVRQAINSFKLTENYKEKLDQLENQLSKVSAQNKEEADALNSGLSFLFDFCEHTLNEKVSLSEKLKRLTCSIQHFQNFPAFFESVVIYLSNQFDFSAEKGYDKDFYKLLLSLKDFEKVPEGNSEGDRVSSLLNKFYAKVKDVVVKKAKESIKNNEDLVKNFDKEFADNYKNLTTLKVCAEKIEQSFDLKNLALFFFKCSRLKEYIESNPIASCIPSFTEEVSSVGKKLENKFSSIKLDEFLLNFFTLSDSESDFSNAFTLCLTSPELNFSEIKDVGNFFALGNDEKNFELLLRVRVNLQSLQQSWYRSDFNNAEINLKTVLELLSKFKGNEKVIQSIKSAVVSYMSNFFNIFIDEFLKEQELKIFNGFSDETFAELFKLFDTPEALNGKNSKEIKRSWFLYLFGFYYKTRGPLSSKATKYFDMVTKSKLIKEKKDRNFILDFFNTLNGGTEQFPVLSDENIRLGLETFFGDDKDFAEIAYDIFDSYKEEFCWRDVASDAAKKVNGLAEKGFSMFGGVKKNFLKGFGNLLS